MSGTSQDRERDHLAQVFRTPLEGWLADALAWCRGRGLSILVYETFRTAERQATLYAQGRTRPGPVITYTLDSSHEYGVACDWVPLRLVRGEWTQDWSHETYNAIYAACPPSRYGLERFPWEAPHLQLAGVNGPDQKTSGSVWAAAQGIKANVIVGSRWPQEDPATLARRGVFLRDRHGVNTRMAAVAAVYEGQRITRLPGGDVQVGPLRLHVYDDGAFQFDRRKT